MSWLRLCKIGSDPILYFPFPFLGCFQFGRFSSLLRISLSLSLSLLPPATPRFRSAWPLPSQLSTSWSKTERAGLSGAEPEMRGIVRLESPRVGALLPLSLSWLSFFHVGSIPGRCSPFSAARSVSFIYSDFRNYGPPLDQITN